MNINFLIIAWRGFSGNNGNPSEQGLYEDGKSAIDWLIKKGVSEKNLILYGESLGTGVATHLAQNKNFAGVILESPFTSMVAAGKSKYPIFPINLLLKDKYESDKKIKNINEDKKKLIIEALWNIIYSDQSADMYETNLMRRLSGLLYLDNKVVGDIKEKVIKKNNDISS